jgi:tRNA(Arg) A34 adenosine deaminase TadA
MDVPPCNDKVREALMQKRYFRHAYHEMEKSEHHVRVGAVLVLKNGKMFMGHNINAKTHPMLKKHYSHFCMSIHAELYCLLQARFEDLTGSKMYIVREDRSKLALIKPARPCRFCMKLIREWGIKKIFYSTSSGYNMEVVK